MSSKKAKNGDDIDVELTPQNIANMLALFIRVDPAERPIEFSPTIIAKLLTRVAAPHTDEASLLECIGCLYILCLYHSMTANLTDSNILECVAMLETIIAECLILMQLKGCEKFDIPHPSEYMDKKDLEAINLYDAFNDGLALAKEFLRELTSQVRAARSLRTISFQYKYTYDFMLPLISYLAENRPRRRKSSKSQLTASNRMQFISWLCLLCRTSWPF